MMMRMEFTKAMTKTAVMRSRDLDLYTTTLTSSVKIILQYAPAKNTPITPRHRRCRHFSNVSNSNISEGAASVIFLGAVKKPYCAHDIMIRAQFKRQLCILQ